MKQVLRLHKSYFKQTFQDLERYVSSSLVQRLILCLAIDAVRGGPMGSLFSVEEEVNRLTFRLTTVLSTLYRRMAWYRCPT